MFLVNGTKITAVQGDTVRISLTFFDQGGVPYIPVVEDIVRFAVKKYVTDSEYVIEKTITDCKLVLLPADTENLQGEYLYDLEITLNNGDVVTSINRGKLIILPAVIKVSEVTV